MPHPVHCVSRTRLLIFIITLAVVDYISKCVHCEVPEEILYIML